MSDFGPIQKSASSENLRFPCFSRLIGRRSAAELRSAAIALRGRLYFFLPHPTNFFLQSVCHYSEEEFIRIAESSFKCLVPISTPFEGCLLVEKDRF